MRCPARVFLLILLMASGCASEDEPVEATKVKRVPAKQAKSAPAKQTPSAPVPVDPQAFADIPSAMTGYISAASADDQATMSLANQWMVAQGPAAVLPLSRILSDDSAPAEQRIVACKVLSQLPGTKAPLLEATAAKKPEVRINAIQALGRLQPIDNEIVDKCIELATSDDPQVQRYAITALGKMGSAAKQATPLLQGILNDTKNNETVRGEARRALKAIDPRKGLIGLE